MDIKKFLSLIMIVFSIFAGAAFAEDGDLGGGSDGGSGSGSGEGTGTGTNTPQAYPSTDPRYQLPLFQTTLRDTSVNGGLAGEKNAKPSTTSYVAGAYNALLRRKIETEIIIKNLNQTLGPNGNPIVDHNATTSVFGTKAVPGNVISKIDIGEDNSLEVSYSQVEIPLDDGRGEKSQQYIPIWVE